MLSFFPRGVLDEILNLIESVSEGFPSYSYSSRYSEYSTIAAAVQIFLSTRDVRKCVENIIFHASHAGFTRDTCSIHANIQVMVKSSVAYFLCAGFSRENRVKSE